MKKKGYYYCDRDEGFRELLFEICDLKASKIFSVSYQTLPSCDLNSHKTYVY